MKSPNKNQTVFHVHGYSNKYDTYLKQMKVYSASVNGKSKAIKKDAQKNCPVKQGQPFTLAAVINKLTGETFVGLSVCHINDNFCKAIGTKIAIDKAVVYKNNKGEIKSGEPIIQFNVDINSVLKEQVLPKLLELRKFFKTDPTIGLQRHSKIQLPIKFENLKELSIK